MATPSLVTLPLEILIRVFSKFSQHQQDDQKRAWDLPPLRARKPHQDPSARSWHSLDNHALFSLSLVSRKTHSVAQTFLYREFAPGYGDSWLSSQYSWHGRFFAFLRTVVSRPDLAELVRGVYIHPLLMDAIDAEDYLPFILEAIPAQGIDLESSEAGINFVHLDNSPSREYAPGAFEGAIEYLKHGSKVLLQHWTAENLKHASVVTKTEQPYIFHGEMMLLLVAHLPKLQHLAIDYTRHQEPWHMPLSAFYAINIVSLQLKRLDLTVLDTPFLYLAHNLEELNLSDLHRRDPFSETNETSFPKLRTLRISRCDIRSSVLRALFSACTGGLVTLALEEGCGRSLRTSRFAYFAAEDVLELLQAHRQTLRNIHLDTSGRTTPKVASQLDFTTFLALRHLLLSSQLVFEDESRIGRGFSNTSTLLDIIPSSLESLCIINDDADRYAGKKFLGLADVKRHQPDRFSNLKLVIGNVRHEDDNFKKVLEAAGIQIISPSCSLTDEKNYLNGPDRAWLDQHIMNSWYQSKD